MLAPRIPDNEQARLQRLHAFAVGDSPSEQSFDDLALVASRICQVPIAMINFVEAKRLRVKSAIGLSLCDTSRDHSFCGHAILSNHLFMVPDASADERFADNPLVANSPHIRFYVGSPLISADGYSLGTLCVMDHNPRVLDAEQAEALATLSRQVIHLLEMQSLLHGAVHQRQLLRDIVDTIPHVVFWKDRKSTYLGCNQAFAATAGLASPADVIGKTDYDLPWTREESDFYRECDQRAMSDGKPLLDIEETLLKADGSPSHVLTSKLPLRGTDGNVNGLLGIFSDVTDRRLAEDRFRTVFQSAGIGIALIDAEGRIVTPNRTFQAMLDFECELEGTRLEDITHPEDREASNQLFRSLMAGERSSYQINKRYIGKNGRLIWVTLTLTRLQNFGTTGPVAVALIEDITERRRTEEELIRHAKIAEELAREQCGLRDAVAGMEQVLGVVGHELRTPLAALRAISEFLVTDGARDTAEADRFLREISEEVDRMSDTVNNLLEAARLNSGRVRWNWSEVDVASAIGDAIESIEPLINSTHVIVRNHVHADACRMAGDGDAIRRLILNLLSNARKHTPTGSIEVSASLSSDEVGRWMEIVVKDTGSGIPPNVAARLGEAFALNSGVVGDNHVSGTGLGLAICKGVAAAHGGGLRFQSQQGVGTTVIVRLRVDLKEAATGDTVQEESTAAWIEDLVR